MKTAVAFFTDSAMLPGLHAALASLAISNPEGTFDVYVFCDKVKDRHKKKLEETWVQIGTKLRLIIEDHSPEPIPGGNALHGNYTTYGRLYLADLLPDYSKCIYLDADLVVNLDLQEFFGLIHDDFTLAACGEQIRGKALEKDLYIKANLDLEGMAFNAGVLGINLDRYRKIDGLSIAKETARTYPGCFKSADQAVLNVAFHDDYHSIDGRFNTKLFPDLEDIGEPTNCIYHFVGSPKPWDPFGSKLHQNYKVWQGFFKQTAIRSVPPWRYYKLKRLILISRQNWRAYQAMKKSKQNS